MTLNESGTAFPTPSGAATDGMSLRDYLAAAALPASVAMHSLAGFLKTIGEVVLPHVPEAERFELQSQLAALPDNTCRNACATAYLYADAMLAARTEAAMEQSHA